MAKQAGIGDRLYVNGFDLSGDVGSLDNLATPRAEIDVTGINKSAKERILGLSDVNIGFTAFYNDAAARSHPALKTLQTTARPVLYARGSTKGQACFMVRAKQVNYDGNRGADGSLLFKVDINGAEGNPGEWGQLICNALTTFADSTQGTTFDGTAKSSKGAAALLHVTNKSSTGSLTVGIQDSTDGTVWTNLLSFTVVASGASRAAERKTVAGVVNRYLRVSTTGAFGNAKLVVGLRRGSSGEVVTY